MTVQTKPIIKKLKVEKFTRIIPLYELKNVVLKDEHDKLEVYRGEREIENIGITVHGSGAWGTFTIDADIICHDYKAIYQVYNLPEDVSADYWFIEYKKHTEHSELKKVFEESRDIPVKIHSTFIIQGNDYDITSVFITFETIRLTLNGVSQDYVVANPNSASAKTPSGDQYPGGFHPV